MANLPQPIYSSISRVYKHYVKLDQKHTQLTRTHGKEWLEPQVRVWWLCSTSLCQWMSAVNRSDLKGLLQVAMATVIKIMALMCSPTGNQAAKSNLESIPGHDPFKSCLGFWRWSHMCSISTSSCQGWLQTASKRDIHRNGPELSVELQTKVSSTCPSWRGLATGLSSSTLGYIQFWDVSLKAFQYILFIVWWWPLYFVSLVLYF